MPEVAQYKIGNTVIRIHDDCCVSDPKEIEAILKRLGSLAARARRREEQQPAHVAPPRDQQPKVS